MLGAAVLDPSVWTGPLKASFGRDQKVGGIWMQRLGDETLGNFGSVGVGGVNQIDAEFDGAPQDSDRLGMILRLSPYAGTGELHRAEAEPANGMSPPIENVPLASAGRALDRREDFAVAVIVLVSFMFFVFYLDVSI